MAGTTSLTSKGQVTIPKEVREYMGLRPFDRIEFYLENGEVKVRKAYPSLEEVAGSLPPLGMPIEEAITQAKEERARRLVDKLR
jgi:AbrB family looped-hinge helix DNA binding protein